MTQKQQQIAIAEACGFKQHKEQIEHTDGYQWIEVRVFWVDSKGQRVAIPDYLTDLNAMHEAEKVLTPTQIDDYMWNLQKVCQPVGYTYKSAICATAAQRAEAFLRTLNLWKE